jgi:hypothetical protein
VDVSPDQHDRFLGRTVSRCSPGARFSRIRRGARTPVRASVACEGRAGGASPQTCRVGTLTDTEVSAMRGCRPKHRQECRCGRRGRLRHDVRPRRVERRMGRGGSLRPGARTPVRASVACEGRAAGCRRGTSAHARCFAPIETEPGPPGAVKKSGTVHFAPLRPAGSMEVTRVALGTVPIFSQPHQGAGASRRPRRMAPEGREIIAHGFSRGNNGRTGGALARAIQPSPGPCTSAPDELHNVLVVNSGRTVSLLTIAPDAPQERRAVPADARIHIRASVAGCGAGPQTCRVDTLTDTGVSGVRGCQPQASTRVSMRQAWAPAPRSW